MSTGTTQGTIRRDYLLLLPLFFVDMIFTVHALLAHHYYQAGWYIACGIYTFYLFIKWNLYYGRLHER